MLNIVAIGGSLRPQSVAYRILGLLISKINLNLDVSAELIDLRQLHLPFCTGEPFYPTYPDVQIFRQKVQAASGILLATPEYHGSLSGVLKNALDLLEESHVTGKMVGLIAVVGGVHSTNAINTLRIICRQLHCWVLPDQIVIERAQTIFNQKGRLIDPFLEQRIDKFATHFVEAIKILSNNVDLIRNSFP
jgi:FMN reductase